jgi:hypothetical protein
MRPRCPARAFLSGAVLVGFLAPAAAYGQTGESDVPSLPLYQAYCEHCHGAAGKGDGPLASVLKRRPPDLTQIARRNGGVFPADQVFLIIDGRNPVKGHGGGDMPKWGESFSRTKDVMPVEARIRRLVSYLESLQVNP